MDIDQDTVYFNVEVSLCKKYLFFNANKKGIDAFLQTYASVARPPPFISFKERQRPQRRGYTQKRLEYIYYDDFTGNPNWNELAPILRIQFLEAEPENIIFCAGLRGDKPFLFLNRLGWKHFLEMIRCSRDRSIWFCVPPGTAHFSGRRPLFKLTSYRGDRRDSIFDSLWFIRLEPEKPMFLTSREKNMNYIGKTQIFWGNCTGLLFLSEQILRFAQSDELAKDILNEWNEVPRCFRCLQCEAEGKTPEGWLYGYNITSMIDYPTWIYLRKAQINSPYPQFSFERPTQESHDIYLFGNKKGFEELALLFESYAFSGDDAGFRRNPPDKRLRGDATRGGLGPHGFWFRAGWMVCGGWEYSLQYKSHPKLRLGGQPIYHCPHIRQEISTFDVASIFTRRTIFEDDTH